MAFNEQTSIRGITDIGSYTGSKGGPYTKTSWGLTTPAGGVIRFSTQTVKQYSGQSIFVQDSFISSAEGQFEFGLINGTLETLRKMLGLPTSALVGDLSAGTPTLETLSISGTLVATEEQSLYLETSGPFGPRTYYLPRCKAATLPEMVHGRDGYFEPRVTFDLYDQNGFLAWIEDEP